MELARGGGAGDEPPCEDPLEERFVEPKPEGVWRYARRQGDAVRMFVAAAVLVVKSVVARHGVLAWEIGAFRWVNSWPGRFFWPIWIAMQLGTFITVPIAAVVALSFRHARLAINLLASGTGAYALALVVKGLVDRPRPAGPLANVILRHMTSTGLGFPSGHAAVATALAVAFFPYTTRSGRAAVWCAAVIVSAARMYVGAHFPLDVLGGAALGTLVGSAVHLAVGAPIEKGRHQWFFHK